MARKVIIDTDPGIDDAVALCMALFDPRWEVVAVTAAGGNVSPAQTSRNVQAIIEQLDPPRYPRTGTAIEADLLDEVGAEHIHGQDGLGNACFHVSALHHQRPSDKIICDEVRAAPNEVTLVCLGPLTNVASAFQRDPGIASLIDRIIIMGGSVSGIGNVTSTAEFNLHYDPESARAVFRSPTTKTLVPLDVTTQVSMSMDFLNEIPSESTRVGSFLHRVLPFIYRAYHQQLGLESIHLHDAVAMVVASDPQLFETIEMHGDVETAGLLTKGMTVFERRENRVIQPNMEVVSEIDIAAVTDCIVRGLRYAARNAG